MGGPISRAFWQRVRKQFPIEKSSLHQMLISISKYKDVTDHIFFWQTIVRLSVELRIKRLQSFHPHVVVSQTFYYKIYIYEKNKLHDINQKCFG
jgi:hypothetical protein